MKITAKNNTTKGLLLCFRPFPMEGSIRDASTNNDSDFKSFSVNEELKQKPKSKVYSSDKESIDGNQKKTARRILSKIVRAVAFQSSLRKKVRNGKIIQDPLRTDSSLSEKIAKSRRRSSSSSSLEEENPLKIDSSISNSSILSSSSSSLSISSSSSIASSWNSSDSSRSLGSISGRQKSFRSDSVEDHPEKKQNNSSSQSSTNQKKKKISGICLLLISLFVLIFWGKFFAIVCTSTWFYFVSTTRRDSNGDNERQILIKFPVEIQSKEYKKKIIMEGFLERNHRGTFHLHQH